MTKKAYIDSETCDKSPFCPAKRICPVKAITQKLGKVSIVDEEKCIGCGKCLNFCPGNAITMK